MAQRSNVVFVTQSLTNSAVLGLCPECAVRTPPRPPERGSDYFPRILRLGTPGGIRTPDTWFRRPVL